MISLKILLDSGGVALRYFTEVQFLHEEKVWTWDETQNTHCKSDKSFLKSLLLFLWPSINLTARIQVEAVIISIRCTMGNGHVKGIQWYCLGRKRKVENLYSVSCSHFPCCLGKTQKFANVPQREDSEQPSWALWAEHAAPCDGGHGAFPADTLKDFPGQRLAMWYSTESKSINQNWGESEASRGYLRVLTKQ